MTTLVTGAAGFLGSHLTEVLLARGERPRVLVRPGDELGSLPPADVDVYRADIGDRAALTAALSGVDRVLNCAARTGPWGPEPEYQQTNVRALGTLVEAALEAGVQRIVHVSSITVHGTNVNGTADETALLRGGSDPYSRSKVAGERLLQRMIEDRGAPVTIVRPGLVYGPRDTANLGRFAALVDHRKMVIIGSGSNHLPLIYVTDAARGILLACAADQAADGQYILVNDEPVTQYDYLSAIASELGMNPPGRHLNYRLALGLALAAESAGHSLRRKKPPPLTRFGVEVLGGENRFAINRARSELGFIPQVSLAEGVRRSIAWYRATRRPGKHMTQAQELPA